MRVALVHNPTSGDSETGGDDLVDLVRRQGHEVAYFPRKRDWHAALDDPPELLVIAGGDGTIRRIAREVAGRGIPLAILPMGTANNVARALGVGHIPVDELIAGWRTGVLRHFDVGAASGPWGSGLFLESVGAGLLSDTIAEIDHGNAGYVNELESADARMKAALDVFERLACRAVPFGCTLRLDDRELSGDFLLVEVLNFGAAGPNLQLSPRSDPSDGEFDVVIVRPDHREQLVNVLESRRSGAARVPDLPVYHARQVELTCECGTLHLDDEVWRGGRERSRVEAVMRPGALQFLVPGVRS